jgi:hypothetical protein
MARRPKPHPTARLPVRPTMKAGQAMVQPAGLCARAGREEGARRTRGTRHSSAARHGIWWQGCLHAWAAVRRSRHGARHDPAAATRSGSAHEAHAGRARQGRTSRHHVPLGAAPSRAAAPAPPYAHAMRACAPRTRRSDRVTALRHGAGDPRGPQLDARAVPGRTSTRAPCRAALRATCTCADRILQTPVRPGPGGLTYAGRARFTCAGRAGLPVRAGFSRQAAGHLGLEGPHDLVELAALHPSARSVSPSRSWWPGPRPPPRAMRSGPQGPVPHALHTCRRCRPGLFATMEPRMEPRRNDGTKDGTAPQCAIAPRLARALRHARGAEAARPDLLVALGEEPLRVGQGPGLVLQLLRRATCHASRAARLPSHQAAALRTPCPPHPAPASAAGAPGTRTHAARALRRENRGRWQDSFSTKRAHSGERARVRGPA